jgi:hypothetical protein
MAADFGRALLHDAEIFRGFAEVASCLTLAAALFARPGFAERVLEVAGKSDAPPPSGPTREEFLRLIA